LTSFPTRALPICRVTANAPSTGYWILPSGYSPRINRIGPTSDKIFLADGGKYTNAYDAVILTLSSTGPTDNHQYNPFADYGAFYGNTKSWDRAAANVVSLREARLFAFRHGRQTAGGSAGDYRLNALFFDGHVETLDDLSLSNPRYWLPTGTRIPSPAVHVPNTP